MKIDYQYRDSISTKFYLNKNENKTSPVILCLPALGVRASYYDLLTNTLHEKGYTTICVDWRGNGESSIRPSRKYNFGYESLIEDIHEIILWINKEFNSPNIYTVGHSLGGQLSCLLSAKYPDLLNGVILIASCTIFHKKWDQKTQKSLKLFWNVSPTINKIMGFYNGKLWGFGGREFITLMDDWFNNAKHGTYKLSGSEFDYDKALSDLKTSVLALTLEGDDLAIEPAAKDLISRFHQDAQIEYLHIRKSQIEIPKPVHFKWTKHPAYFVDLIDGWIKRN